MFKSWLYGLYILPVNTLLMALLPIPVNYDLKISMFQWFPFYQSHTLSADQSFPNYPLAYPG